MGGSSSKPASKPPSKPPPPKQATQIVASAPPQISKSTPSILKKNSCNIDDVSRDMNASTLSSIAGVHETIMSQTDILLKQLTEARQQNTILYEKNSSLYEENRFLTEGNYTLTKNNNTLKYELKSLNGEVINLSNLNYSLTINQDDLIHSVNVLQKKEILDKLINVVSENEKVLNQIKNNSQEYSTDFQKIYYKKQQIENLKDFNFYLLIAYYLFTIILIYYAFFNKNAFSLYFKISWIIIILLLPLFSFYVIDSRIQLTRFLWDYILSFVYGDSYHYSR